MTDVVVQDNLILATGGVLKPRDDAENPYMFRASAPPISAANLNEPVFLPNQSHNPRVPIQYQESIGSCGGFGTGAAAAACHNEARYRAGQSMNAQMPHGGYIYYRARVRRNWFPEDTGSYASDCADLIIIDTALMTQHRYVNDAAYAYPDNLPALDNTLNDYALSHQPFYPRQGNVLENIWLALKAGYPVVIGMAWPDPFFRPDARGRLPLDSNGQPIVITPNDSGHLIYCWGYAPPGDLYCQNSWSSGWNANIPQVNFCRPGDFIIPAVYVKNLTTGPIWEYRVISPEKIEVIEDDVQPPPPPVLTVKGRATISTASNIIVTPDKPLTLAQKRELKGVRVTVTKGV